MSAAQKYGRAAEGISAETLSQAKQAGQTLADKGVTHQASLGTGAPAPTPAMKYGGNDTQNKSITPPSRSR